MDNNNYRQPSPYQSPYGQQAAGAGYGSAYNTNGQPQGYGGAYANGQPQGYGGACANGQPHPIYPGVNNPNAYRQTMGQSGANGAAKEKKPEGFGVTLAKCAAVALIFGLVAGGIFTGVSYAGAKMLGISAPASAGADKEPAKNGGVKPDDTTAPASVQMAPTASGTAKDIRNVADIVEEVMPGIVAITNTSVVTYQSFFGGYQQYEAESRGSGIIIKQDSDYLYIATNNHVVSGARTLSVQFFNDVAVDGEIQGTYAANDLAVVKVALNTIDSATLSQIHLVSVGDSDSLKVGEGTIAIGNALGYGQSVTTGIVSALHRSITVQDDTTGAVTTCDNLIQTDAAINPGNSGGALLDSEGLLIGINSAKYADTDVEGIGYAIPITDAMEIVNALIAGETLEKTQAAYLGISGSDVSSDVAAAYGLPQGVYVKTVYDGSGAADAGICQGDIITGVNGKEITRMTELQNLLMDYSAGDTVTVTLWRMNNGYQEMELSVTLSDAGVLDSGDSGRGNNDNGNSNGYYDGFFDGFGGWW